MLFFLLLICFFIYLISNTSLLLFAKKHFVNQATFFTFAVALGLFHSFLYGALSETGVKTRKCITLIFFSFTFCPPSFGVNNNFSYNKEYYTPDTDFET